MPLARENGDIFSLYIVLGLRTNGSFLPKRQAAAERVALEHSVSCGCPVFAGGIFQNPGDAS